ncbi:MAG TPA: hypothetical protein VMT32_16505 [Bryobacteraceae bacterium]|nr:hypothetical protein [Bryobacteraceae bacterium]
MSPFDPKPVPQPQPVVVQPPAAPPFRPTFRQDVIGTSAYGGSWQLNPYYFATSATADYMAQRFHAIGWIEVPVFPAGGPFSVNVAEIHLMLAGGISYNCGLLAQYFVQYPEDQLPGLAESKVNEAIANLQQRAAR